MKTLTPDQIEAVIAWMNNWDQLEYTVIPLRFKEEWTKQLDSVSHRAENTPLGLTPKWICNKKRQGEIMAAISRYSEAGKTPPKEWAIEFASLTQ